MRGGVAAGLMALGTVAAPMDAQRASLPARSVEGIGRVVILCLAVDGGTDRLRWQKRLCDQIQAIAARGAPVPVAAIGFGDPVLLERDVLGVLVHAAVDRSGPRPMAILSLRPHRAAADQTVLFGAAPVAVPLDADGGIPDAVLATALDQILPWRMRGTAAAIDTRPTQTGRPK